MLQLAEKPPAFLIDENIAADVAAALTGIYPRSLHVSQIGLLGASDEAIWRHARQHDLVVVSKDEDFHRLSILHGPPPKVVWLRLGDCSTDEIIRLRSARRDVIESFLAKEEAGFLVLT